MGVRGKKKYFLKYHIPYERSEESNYIFISKKKSERDKLKQKVLGWSLWNS